MKKLVLVKPSGFNNNFMSEALLLAAKAYNCHEVPVGVVIVNRITQMIVAKAHNLSQEYNNPLMHAEIIAINTACRRLHSKYLFNCDIYVSLEPCAMCAAAISYTKIARLFYAASDVKQGAVENGIRFFTTSSCFYRPEIYVELLADNSQQLMRSFFSRIRKNDL